MKLDELLVRFPNAEALSSPSRFRVRVTVQDLQFDLIHRTNLKVCLGVYSFAVAPIWHADAPTALWTAVTTNVISEHSGLSYGQGDGSVNEICRSSRGQKSARRTLPSRCMSWSDLQLDVICVTLYVR